MDLEETQDVLELLNEIDWQNSDPEEWSALSWPWLQFVKIFNVFIQIQVHIIIEFMRFYD